MSENSLLRNDSDEDIPRAEPVIRVLHAEEPAEEPVALTSKSPLKRLPENRYIDLRDALTYEHPEDALRVLQYCIEGMNPAFIPNPNYPNATRLSDISQIKLTDLTTHRALLLFGPKNAPVDAVLLTDDVDLVERNHCRRLNFSDIFYHCACSMLGRDISYSTLEIALHDSSIFDEDPDGAIFQIDPPQGAVVKLTHQGFEKNPKVDNSHISPRKLRQLFPSYDAYLHAIGHADGVGQSDITDMPKSRREKTEAKSELPWSGLAIFFAVLTIIASVYVIVSNFAVIKLVFGF